MKKLLFAGTFDPPTNGHLDIIRRAAAEGQLTVGVFINPNKTCLFSAEERAEMLRRMTADLEQVTVIIHDGYTADYAKAGGYSHLVRGYRNETDLAYETEMADYNRRRGGVETLLLKADPALTGTSSTAVREALERGDTAYLAAHLSPACLTYLRERAKKNPSTL